MGYNIIGIVGPLASGKGVLTDYLIRTHGYTSFSLSSLVHEELKKEGVVTFTRTTLQDKGDEMRRNGGEGILAKMAIARLTEQRSKKIVIEGIRNPGEVAYLRSIPGFILIAVDAPQKVRYARVISRAKPWDPKDWDTFCTVDGRDRGDGENKNGQQVKKCMQMANYTIINDGDKATVEKKVEDLLFSQ